MTRIDPTIHESWKSLLIDEFNRPYFIALREFLVDEKQKHVVYPPGNKIFSAFDRTPFDSVKAVILGQDPYHGKGQAHGLCFSVPHGIQAPPSLVNIFRELHEDLGIPMPGHGNLEAWADRGVLLLNATLTVRANQAGSHQNKGWEQFTDCVIKKLSDQKEGLVFILWGSFAQAKAGMVNVQKHHILRAAHPSPFSASSGFFGCRHFSRTNTILEGHGKEPIDWNLS